MQILGIDTSGKVASCAIMSDGVLKGEKSIVTRLTHSQVILPMVKDILADCETSLAQIDCVAIANGPGSYTGLRIGIGAIKGMCMGQPTLKCAGVSTLEALAYNLTCFEGKVFTIMKARPQVVYFGGFEIKNGVVKRIYDDRVDDEKIIADLVSGETDNSMLIGDYCKQFKETYLNSRDNFRLAPATENLQRASALCLAVNENPQYIITADELNALYLQATKAEKDKAHR